MNERIAVLENKFGRIAELEEKIDRQNKLLEETKTSSLNGEHIFVQIHFVS